MTETELCWRCPTPMEWRHGTWQCPRCHFKLGCCEGDPQTPCEVLVPEPGPVALRDGAASAADGRNFNQLAARDAEHRAHLTGDAGGIERAGR
jgi:hypothetical protein